MNKYNLKKISLIILVVIIAVLVVLSLKPKEIIAPATPNDTVVSDNKIYNLCYYRSNKTDRGFYDIAWLKINTFGSENNKVTGEFQNIPAEKDSKVGTFEGTVGPLDQKIMARRANVWWESRAEGMEVKEELAIQFGDGSATVGFGEMVDRGDGVYVYKDKKNLTYIDSLSQMDCEYLNEKLFTEKYVRDNIKTIASDKPVLGGSWYVLSVLVNPATHTGEVTYEDGHIQSKANFIYSYSKNPESISLTKFEVIK